MQAQRWKRTLDNQLQWQKQRGGESGGSGAGKHWLGIRRHFICRMELMCVTYDDALILPPNTRLPAGAASFRAQGCTWAAALTHFHFTPPLLFISHLTDIPLMDRVLNETGLCSPGENDHIYDTLVVNNRAAETGGGGCHADTDVPSPRPSSPSSSHTHRCLSVTVHGDSQERWRTTAAPVTAAC